MGPRLPTGLVQRVRAGQAILVAGMGFAEGAATVGWEPLLRRLTERFTEHASGDGEEDTARGVLDMINRGRLRAALAWLRQRLPESVVAQVLADAQPRGTSAAASILLAAQLPWRGVVTSSFEDAWERTLRSGPERPFHRVDARQLAEGAREDEGEAPFLVHALGTPDVHESLCLCAADLRRRGPPAAVGAFLRGLFAERSFVFLGFRPGDPDLALLMENILGAAPTSAEHFLLFQEETGSLGPSLTTELMGAELDVTAVAFTGSLEDLLRGWVSGGDGAVGAASPTATAEVPVPELLARGEHTEWLRQQRAAIDAAPPGERATIYEQMGDVYRERLQSPVQAIASYRSALAHGPARRSVLAKLAELYAAHKHWRAAEEILVKLAHTEGDAERRAHYLCRAAHIAGEELDNPVRAAQLLERALDDVPDLAEGFEALERLLSQEKNWQALARLYQKTVRELPADGRARALKLRAASGLADLALRFSKDPKVALKALEVADALEPGNVERKALMAGLYAQVGPTHVEKAIAMHHGLLALDPDRLPSYRALAELYRSVGDRDRLWCVAATLTFLRKGDEELRDTFERGKAVRMGPLTGRFSPELWSRVAHPDEDPVLAALFGIVGPLLAGRHAETPESLGLQPEERVDVTWDERPATRATLTAARWLDLPTPALFFRLTDRRAAALKLLRSGPDLFPALLVGAPVLTKPDPAEVMFTIARHLVMLRPDKTVCAVDGGAPSAGLAVRTALYLAGLRPLEDEDRAAVEAMAGEFRASLPLPAKEAVNAAAREIAARAGLEPNVTRWAHGVELSAARAAFLLVNDLGAAARSLAAEASASQGLSAKARLKDLVAFSVSEAYFNARAALGLARPG